MAKAFKCDRCGKLMETRAAVIGSILGSPDWQFKLFRVDGRTEFFGEREAVSTKDCTKEYIIDQELCNVCMNEVVSNLKVIGG